MLIRFHSQAAGEVIMFSEVASQILDALGYSGGKGALREDQLPQAITVLKELRDKDIRVKDAQEKQSEPHVGIGQRIFPLVELMERSLQSKTAVTWEALN